jgi:hypothetical protein
MKKVRIENACTGSRRLVAEQYRPDAEFRDDVPDTLMMVIEIAECADLCTFQLKLGDYLIIKTVQVDPYEC